MNNKILWVVLVLVAVVGAIWIFTNQNKLANTGANMNATSTETVATNTQATGTGLATGTTAVGGISGTGAAGISGYPSSWPTDVPKYISGKVVSSAGNNPQSGPKEASVVVSTDNAVRTVVDFYLSGLRANG